MRANYFKSIFGFTTFGESHGKAMGVVIEDVKPNIEFPFKKIQKALNQRKPGKNELSSSRKEADKFEVLSGVFEGKTTGMPLCIVVYNTDARSKDYQKIMNVFRPGHADYSYFKKFKIYDYRGGGRASGRETIARVIAGELVDHLLKDIKINIITTRIGRFKADKSDKTFTERNPFNWPDKNNYDELKHYLDKIKTEKDSVGGILEVKISNLRAGLGDPVFEKLDANLAKAVMSIGAIKGIEFGQGFQLAKLKGSEANDQLNPDGFLNNKQGGILGGISNGEDVIFRIVVKPTPSIGKKQDTINKKGQSRTIKISGRHDTCIITRIIPVVISMIKLVLADAIQYQNLMEARNTDSISNLREAIDKIDEDILASLYKRQQLSHSIGSIKRKKSIPLEDLSREREIIKNLQNKANTLKLDKDFIKTIWQNILKNSKDSQC